MTPIANYIEKSFFKEKNEYILFNDRIEIKGKGRQGTYFEITVPLNELRLPKDKYLIEDQSRLWIFIALGFIGFFSTMFIASKFPVLFTANLFFSLLFFWIFFAFLGLFQIKKKIYYVYNSKYGNPAVVIGQSGNKKEELEYFINKIEEKMKSIGRKN